MQCSCSSSNFLCLSRSIWQLGHNPIKLDKSLISLTNDSLLKSEMALIWHTWVLPVCVGGGKVWVACSVSGRVHMFLKCTWYVFLGCKNGSSNSDQTQDHSTKHHHCEVPKKCGWQALHRWWCRGCEWVCVQILFLSVELFVCRDIWVESWSLEDVAHYGCFCS